MAAMTSVLEAIKSGDSDAVRAAVQSDPEVGLSRTESGATLIQTAVYYGRPELAATLAGPLQPDFHSAIALGDAAAVSRLLGEDPSRRDDMSQDGFTPLCLASAFGSAEIVRALLASGADPNLRSSSLGGVAPIHSAVFGRVPEIVRLLLEAGAEPNARQEGGYTALHAAAQHGDLEIVNLLLESGADRALKDDNGKTAKDHAAGSNHHSLVSILETT